MPTYRMDFERNAPGFEGTVSFDADTPSPIFKFLDRKDLFGPVKIWQGRKLLGEIRQDNHGVWHIGKIATRAGEV